MNWIKKIILWPIFIIPLILVSCNGVKDYVVRDAVVVKQNNKKHYFYIMTDSATSFRILDSLYVLRHEHKTNNRDVDMSDDLYNQGLTMFNGWKMGLNVLTTGVRTESGLSGFVGGAAYNSTATQFDSRITREVYTEAYDNLFRDLSNNKDIDEVYVDWPQWYKPNGFRKQETFKKTLPDPGKKIKYKDTMGKSSDISTNSTKNQWIKLADDVDANKNTFSFFISDTAHDNRGTTYLREKGLLDNLLALINRLKTRKIYDNSQIIITSDHGNRVFNNYGEVYGDSFDRNKSLYLQIDSQLLSGGGKAFKSNAFDLSDYTKKWNSTNIATFDPKDFKFDKKLAGFDANNFFQTSAVDGGGNIKKGAIGTFMTTLLYKPIKADLTKQIDVDDDNLYLSSDALSILYKTMNMDPKHQKFNFYEYIPGYKNKPNSNGDLNSYVEDPFNTDLSNRRVFIMWKNNDWGLRKSLNVGHSIAIFKGPFFKISSNLEIITWQNNFKYFSLDAAPIYLKPTWLQAMAKHLHKTNNKEGLHFVGTVIGKLLEKI